MSRDHYKGVPKTRDAQVDAQGRLKPLEKGGGKPAVTLFNQGNTNVEIVSYRADGATVRVYVDAINGNDSNNGTTPNTPLKTLIGVHRKFPLHMLNESRTIVNLMNNTNTQVTYTVGSLHVGGGDEILVNSYVYRGPAMILITPTTGPAAAALDSTPAVIVNQAGAADGTGRRTRLDFTSAAPGWTTNDLAGNFVRVSRNGTRVFDELPITENNSSALFIDCLGIVGVILSTDVVEIVEPAVIVSGLVSSFSVVGGRGAGGFLGNTIADEMGAVFERLSFSDMMSSGVDSLQFDRCRFGDNGGFGSIIMGGSVNFRNTITKGLTLQLLCSSTTHPVGRSDDAPLNPAVQVALNAIQSTLLIGGSAASNPRAPACLVFSYPVASYRAAGDGIRIYGNGTSFMMDSNTALTGSGNAVGVTCKQGGYCRINGGALTTIAGSSGDLRLTTGATIKLGTAAGQFQEAAGWNGNFTRALEGTATAPTGDGSIITTHSIS